MTLTIAVKSKVGRGYTVSACRIFFFFSSRRRHTRLTCDWSSDVCSSDLLKHTLGGRRRAQPERSKEFGCVATQCGVALADARQEVEVLRLRQHLRLAHAGVRSEERRVGKERRSRWWPGQ